MYLARLSNMGNPEFSIVVITKKHMALPAYMQYGVEVFGRIRALVGIHAAILFDVEPKPKPKPPLFLHMHHRLKVHL